MKNHQSRPTSSSPFPEANTTSFPEANATSFKGNHGRGCGRGPRRGRAHVVLPNILLNFTKHPSRKREKK
jgi:hypothetical protein